MALSVSPTEERGLEESSYKYDFVFFPSGVVFALASPTMYIVHSTYFISYVCGMPFR